MSEVVLALVWREIVEEGADAVPEAFSGSLTGFAQEVLELCEHHFDRVQVGAVGRQEEQRCSACFNERGGLGALVAGKIVEDDDVAGLELGHKILPDILGEDCPVHGLINDERGNDPVAGEPGEECGYFPVASRGIAANALSAWTASVASDHVRGDAGFVEEDQSLRAEGRLHRQPCLASFGHVRPKLLGGVNAFF
jgi:hypothetical protein